MDMYQGLYFGSGTSGDNHAEMNLELENAAPQQYIPTPDDGVLFGTSMTHGIQPKRPVQGEFVHAAEQMSTQAKPVENVLRAPHTPTITPPPSCYFPSSPVNGYSLEEDARYSRGFVYTAPYDLGELDVHKHQLINIVMPPLVACADQGKLIVADMVQMVPGVPFVFKFNGDILRTHTIACVQTLGSLAHYPDFNNILSCSVRLAQLSWGCQDSDGHEQIGPVYHLPGLKINDRSESRAHFQTDTFDGSYSLGNTVMKGEGLGTFLPSVQADSTRAHSQIKAILKTLHELYRLVMPKCLSKFEYDIMEFHMDFNNVFSFGGFGANGTSVQLNVSSLGKPLDASIGRYQGSWHADISDDPQFWSLFILLLRIGPDGDPGPFFIARGGLYVHELNAWILFLVFKGTDIHSGVAPQEDPKLHSEWVKSVLDSMWNLAGPQNRLGYVIYLGIVPSRRLGSMNVTPPTGFSNYGSSAVHKSTQKNFATHGRTTLGNQSDYANRLGRELISDFYNSLHHAGLAMKSDVDDLLQSLYYKEDGTGSCRTLQPLRYHPVKDVDKIKKLLALYAWHSNESDHFNLGITNKMLLANRKQLMTADAMLETAIALPIELEHPIDIVEVLGRRMISGKPVFTVRLRNVAKLYNIEQNSLSIQGNETIAAWMMVHLTALSSESHRGIQYKPNLSSCGGASVESTATEINVAGSDGLTSTLPNDENELNRWPVPHSHVPLSTETSLSSPRNENSITGGNIGNIATSARRSGRQPQLKPTITKRKYGNISNSTSSSDNSSSDNHDDDDDADEINQGSKAGTPTGVCAQESSVTEDLNGPATQYEVEEIVGHDFTDLKNKRWLVKWKHYSTDQNSFVEENDLLGCLELLAEYNQRHHFQNAHLSDSVRVTRSKPAKAVPASLSPISELAANLNQLFYLLDENRLDNEIAALISQFQKALDSGKEYWSTSASLSSLIQLWADHCSGTYNIAGCLPFFKSSSNSGAFLRFKLMEKGLSFMPMMDSHIHQLDLLGRGLQTEMCRALVLVYDWYSITGPWLSQLLMNCHQDKGYQGVAEQSPQFATLVDHVVQYNYGCIMNAIDCNDKSRKSPKRRKRPETSLAYLRKLPATHFGPTPAPDLAKLPSNLYGLLESKNERSFVKLPPFNVGRLPIRADPLSALYTASAQCLEELWSRELIIPHIKPLDSYLWNSTTSTTQSHGVRNRAITRGAILTCLQSACQSDGVFASDGMKHFLSRPSYDLFSGTFLKEDRLAGCLEGSRREDMLLPLIAAIRSHLQDNPAVVDKVARVGLLVEDHLLAIHGGGTTSFEEGRSLTEYNSSACPVPAYANLGELQSANFNIPSQHFSSPNFAPIALILRESLNRERGLPHANESLYRVLLGQHPSRSIGTTFSPSQTNPVRQFSEYARLLEKHLPGYKLSSKQGISNLLSWMGTGQGLGTEAFLSNIARPGGFYSSDISNLLEIFKPAMSNNCTLSLQLKPGETSIRMRNIPGFIPCFDMNIWGQANNLFDVTPTLFSAHPRADKPSGNDQSTLRRRKITVDEKFEPYWQPRVQEQWSELLGDMLDCDPVTWTGPRPGWKEVLVFLQKLRIPLFGKGLTLFQTANNIVFAGLATVPSKAVVAHWIFKNKDLGAYRGLGILGFKHLTTLESVILAFATVYAHLDGHLSDSDKQILGFNPLFLEHLLCKVTRWSARLMHSKANGNIPTFGEMAKALEESAPLWVENNNLDDHLAIPVPLTMSSERIAEVFRSIVVSELYKSRIWNN